jgi:hypothetical protein
MAAMMGRPSGNRVRRERSWSRRYAVLLTGSSRGLDDSVPEATGKARMW